VPHTARPFFFHPFEVQLTLASIVARLARLKGADWADLYAAIATPLIHGKTVAAVAHQHGYMKTHSTSSLIISVHEQPLNGPKNQTSSSYRAS
jgi:hypothetical protein